MNRINLSVETNKIKKVEIAPGIVVYDDVIPNHETFCQDLEDGMASIEVLWKDASVRKGPGETIVDTSTRDTKSFGMQYHGRVINEYSNLVESFYSNLNNILFTAFDPIERDYKNMFGVNAPSHDSYNILKYGVGQKFVNHIDDHQEYHRRVSTVYYANDNYTGGEILFPRFNLEIKPKANQMIIFPSTYVYNHSVVPVTSGERYAIVSWMK